MQVTIWTITTCVPDENEPCIPCLYGTAAEAEAAFAKDMREEWPNNAPLDDDGNEMPFPDDPHEAHRLMAENPEWGRYELMAHHVTLPDPA